MSNTINVDGTALSVSDDLRHQRGDSVGQKSPLVTPSSSLALKNDPSQAGAWRSQGGNPRQNTFLLLKLRFTVLELREGPDGLVQLHEATTITPRGWVWNHGLLIYLRQPCRDFSVFPSFTTEPLWRVAIPGGNLLFRKRLFRHNPNVPEDHGIAVIL